LRNCAGCGLCILESKVVIGKGLDETMVYDYLKPGEMLPVDTACNLPKTVRGNCYLMIVACSNSGYVCAYHMTSNKASSTSTHFAATMPHDYYRRMVDQNTSLTSWVSLPPMVSSITSPSTVQWCWVGGGATGEGGHTEVDHEGWGEQEELGRTGVACLCQHQQLSHANWDIVQS
jgi:hypothetical protein